MLILSFLVTALIIYGLGRLLVARLGWPTSLTGAGRWGLVLLGLAVFFSGLPELFRRLETQIGPIPSVGLQDLLPGLCVIALGILGYVAWTRDAVAREVAADEESRARRLPRRRALPPAPQGNAEARPGAGFRALDVDDEGGFAPDENEEP
jgi:hypothetical protein